MDAYGVPEGKRQSIREFTSDREYEEFYIPPSRRYLGMRLVGTRRADTVHCGYIEYWNADGTRSWFSLPVD